MALICQIKREKVRAVFVENISSPRLIETIAKEFGQVWAARSIPMRSLTRQVPRAPIST